MDVFPKSEEVLAKESREKKAKDDFLTGKITFNLITSSLNYSKECLKWLLKVKMLFQVQLPKMPREYILKQLFDGKHNILCMSNYNELIGAVCFRPFYENDFCEIVFLAVNFSSQIKGNGGFMMNVFKEVFKMKIYEFKRGKLNNEEVVSLTANDIVYDKKQEPIFFMTYADNSAIGFFRKQGFTQNLVFDKWVGYIKDYEGGTLMECRVYWELDYLNIYDVINTIRQDVFNKVSDGPSYGPLPVNSQFLYEIPLLSKKIAEGIKIKSVGKTMYDFLFFIISDLSAHSSSWPFLYPVNQKEVPDYYKIIKRPMDFSKMCSKLEQNIYKSVAEFILDFELVVSNCKTYNPPNSQYYKCAEKIKEYFDNKMNDFRTKDFYNYKIK